MTRNCSSIKKHSMRISVGQGVSRRNKPKKSGASSDRRRYTVTPLFPKISMDETGTQYTGATKSDDVARIYRTTARSEDPCRPSACSFGRPFHRFRCIVVEHSSSTYSRNSLLRHHTIIATHHTSYIACNNNNNNGEI